jgi:hypothetical protein
LIPQNLPAAVTFAEAAASCRAGGQQILRVGSPFLYEGLRSYLKNIAATASLWIGPVTGYFLAIKMCRK